MPSSGGGGISAIPHVFQGITQAGVPGWNLNWVTLTNGTFQTIVASGTYTSGGAFTGTIGQTCTLTAFNGGGSGATATVALTGTNTIAGGTALTITAGGNDYNFGASPVTATLGNGTAACSGTATLSVVLSGTDPTHLRSVLAVAANTTLLGNNGTNSLGPWTVTPVTTTNPSVTFEVEARSPDNVDSGSMALSYACAAPGASVDNPTPVALTALSLPTISSTKSIYTSTQSITCTGTAAAPADLYVWWTPTAPSGGTLTLLRWTLTY